MYHFNLHIIHHFIRYINHNKGKENIELYIDYMRKSPGHVWNNIIRRAYIKYTQ